MNKILVLLNNFHLKKKFFFLASFQNHLDYYCITTYSISLFIVKINLLL